MMVNEKSFEIRIKSVMQGTRQVLVKLMFFQLSGHGHPQDDTTLSFFPGSGSSIFLLMYNLFQNSFGKLVKTLKRAKGGKYIWRTLYI